MISEAEISLADDPISLEEVSEVGYGKEMYKKNRPVNETTTMTGAGLTLSRSGEYFINYLNNLSQNVPSYSL
jgi:hypothetical protein